MGQRIDGMFMKLGLLLILLVVSFPAYAQNFDWKLASRGGEEYSHIALERLSNDTLYFLHKTNYADWIQIDSVAWLRRERRSAILPATIIGAVGGGTVGFALKPVAKNQEEANVYSAAFGAVIGGVVGYLVSSVVQSDEVYNISSLDHESRVEKVKVLFK